MALPTGDIMGYRRPLFVIGGEGLQTLAGKLDFPGIGAKLVSPVGAPLGIKIILRVAGTILIVPAESGSLFVILGHGNDIVAFSVELLPRAAFRKLRQIPKSFGPVVLRLAFSVKLLFAQLFRNEGEDFIVRLGFAQRLNAFLLTDNDAPVVADLSVSGVAAAHGPFAQIIALQVCAGGEDDIGVSGFAAPPAVLVNDKLKAAALVHSRPLVCVGHGAEEAAAVSVEHLYGAFDGILVLVKLLLNGLAAEAITEERV